MAHQFVSDIDLRGQLQLSGSAGTAGQFVVSGGPSGLPVYRALVASDIPALSYVTSVALSLPALFSVTGSPITSSGTLTATLTSQNANVVLAGPSSGSAAAPTFRSLVAADLGTTLAPQFGSIGIGVAPQSGVAAAIAGSTMTNRPTLTAAAGVYTLDVTAANEFITGAAIAGATTVNLSNLASIPSGYVWRGVFSFSYTSGTITWFSGNAGYTVKWDGNSAITPTAGEVETVVISVVGGGTTIEVAALKGRT